MKTREYKITFEKVHFRTKLLKYSDSLGTAEVYFEESAVPEYDWVGDEPSFSLAPKRLSEVLVNIHEWADEHGVKLKIWKKDELGI